MRDPVDAAPNPRWAGRRTVLVAAAALVAAGRAPSARASKAQPVRIGGTGGAIGTVRALAEAQRRRDPAAAELQLLPNLGTSGGIAAVLEGAADIALAARLPTDAERAAGARHTPYARTPFAFATRAGGAAVRAVALDDVARIYAGELAEWPGGAPIRVVRRPASDSDTLTLEAVSPAMARAVTAAQRRPGLVTAGTDQDNADALEAVHGSFGAITLAQFLSEGRKLALFALDGVEPTPDAVAAGRYPLSKTFCFVTRSEPAPEAAAFMAFVAGPEGGAVLAGLGQEPVARARERAAPARPGRRPPRHGPRRGGVPGVGLGPALRPFLDRRTARSGHDGGGGQAARPRRGGHGGAQPRPLAFRARPHRRPAGRRGRGRRSARRS